MDGTLTQTCDEMLIFAHKFNSSYKQSKKHHVEAMEKNFGKDCGRVCLYVFIFYLT